MVKRVSEEGAQRPGTCPTLTRCPKMSKCWDGSDQDREVMLEVKEVETCREEMTPLCLSLRGYAICIACKQSYVRNRMGKQVYHVPRS